MTTESVSANVAKIARNPPKMDAREPSNPRKTKTRQGFQLLVPHFFTGLLGLGQEQAKGKRLKRTLSDVFSSEKGCAMERYRSLVMFFFVFVGASPVLAQSAPAPTSTTAPAVTAPPPIPTTAPPTTTPMPTPAAAATPRRFDMYDGQWHFALAPYVWLPRINSTLNVPALLNPDGSIAIGTGPSSYLKLLNGGVLLTALARRGNFAVIGDLMYLNLSQSTVNAKTANTLLGPFTVNVQSQTRLTSTIFTGGASYTVVRQAGSDLDLMLGFRYVGVGGSLGVQAYPPAPLLALSASRSNTGSGANAVFGMYGNVALSERWFLPYYMDVGTGSADFTWMGWAGIGYGSPYNAIVLIYKNLYYNRNGQGVLVNNLNMGGAALGYVFRF